MDRYLNKVEFERFLNYVNPNLNNKQKANIFEFTNSSNIGKINFKEFKESLNKTILICRIKDVFMNVQKLKISKED